MPEERKKQLTPSECAWEEINQPGAYVSGEISAQAVQQVRKAVTGTISGVKVVFKEPFKK